MPTPVAPARARRGSPPLLPAPWPALRRTLLGVALIGPPLGTLGAGCGRATGVEGDAPFECEDDADNDADGQRDCADRGCATAAPCQDDDGDGAPAVEDCDDADPEAYPGATERPHDGHDNDCDPRTPDDDLDEDGHGVATDCDDADRWVGPDAEERPYDGVDNDCDPSTPDDDLDGDGAVAAADCDDADPARADDQPEAPYDGVDNDCDPTTPDDDLDGDGADHPMDCDDADPLAAPGEEELAYSGRDEDCDPSTPDDDHDRDGDGLGADCDDTDPSVGAGAWAACVGLAATGAAATGAREGQELGAALAPLPDLDGDGLPELLVGAPGAADDAGLVLLFAAADLTAGAALGPTEAAGALHGSAPYDRLGDPERLSAAPALAGWGPTALIGAPGMDPGGYANAGALLLVPAADLLGAAGPAEEAAALLVVGRAASDRLGARATTADLDGDGLLDVIFTSPGDDQLASNGGAVAVLWGAGLGEGARSVEDADLLLGGSFNQRIGEGGLLAVGDLDGDGLPELAMGSPAAAAGERGAAGLVHLLSPGAAAAAGATRAALSTTTVLTLRGARSGDDFGAALAAPGDLDGDGRAELLVGAPRGELDGLTNSGALHLWWGAALGTGTADAEAAGLRWGGGAALSGLGAGLSTADLDEDGLLDILIPEPYGAGAPHVWWLAGAEATAWGGGALDADAAGRAWTAAGAGDPTAAASDGERLLIGAPKASVGGLPDAGRLWSLPLP
jgi:hypothetical protein